MLRVRVAASYLYTIDTGPMVVWMGGSRLHRMEFYPFPLSSFKIEALKNFSSAFSEMENKNETNTTLQSSFDR